MSTYSQLCSQTLAVKNTSVKYATGGNYKASLKHLLPKTTIELANAKWCKSGNILIKPTSKAK